MRASRPVLSSLSAVPPTILQCNPGAFSRSQEMSPSAAATLQGRAFFASLPPAQCPLPWQLLSASIATGCLPQQGLATGTAHGEVMLWEPEHGHVHMRLAGGASDVLRLTVARGIVEFDTGRL